jgi:acetolactate synthase-1/2/3 large subunit
VTDDATVTQPEASESGPPIEMPLATDMDSPEETTSEREPAAADAQPTAEAAEPAAEPEPEADADEQPTAEAAEPAAEPEPEAEPDTRTELDATNPDDTTVEAAAVDAPPAEPDVEAEPDTDTEPGTETENRAMPEIVPKSAAEPSGEPETVALLIAKTLRSFGVRMAFTVPGESFLGLMESLSDEGIRVVTTRHEGAAGFMAEAYGQLTGRPAVAIGTRAVGAANLAIAVHTARQNSTPMVTVIGQVVRKFRGREAFQEVDQVASFGRLAKWAVELSDRNAVPAALEELSRHLRTGRPGPVYLSVPEDLLDDTFAQAVEPPPFRPRSPDLDTAAVRRVLHQVAAAKRPVILAGAGVLRARATADLVQLAEMLEVPVIASWRRPDVFPNEHPLYLGMAGYAAPSTVRERLRSADFLLVLGCRLSEITSFEYAVPARGQAWAHVDLEPRSNVPGVPGPRLSVTADTRSFLRSAVERLRAGVLEAAVIQAREVANREDRAAYEQASIVDADPWDGPGVHPGRIVSTLASVIGADTVVTTDAGNFGHWAARGLRFSRPGTFLGPTSGAMGYALPAAIAAGLTRPNRHTIALAGDGGFAMTMAEIETAVRERARVIALVFDNERYGTIRAHQEKRGTGKGLGTDLGPVDFAAIARAMGARGISVDDDAAFEPALREALAHPGPTVIHLALDRRWLGIDSVLEPEA